MSSKLTIVADVPNKLPQAEVLSNTRLMLLCNSVPDGCKVSIIKANSKVRMTIDLVKEGNEIREKFSSTLVNLTSTEGEHF